MLFLPAKFTRFYDGVEKDWTSGRRKRKREQRPKPSQAGGRGVPRRPGTELREGGLQSEEVLWGTDVP